MQKIAGKDTSCQASRPRMGQGEGGGGGPRATSCCHVSGNCRQMARSLLSTNKTTAKNRKNSDLKISGIRSCFVCVFWCLFYSELSLYKKIVTFCATYCVWEIAINGTTEITVIISLWPRNSIKFYLHRSYLVITVVTAIIKKQFKPSTSITISKYLTTKHSSYK